MRIRMMAAINSAERSLYYGQLVEVSEEIGTAWIADGLAEAEEPQAETVHVIHAEPPVDEPPVAAAAAASEAGGDQAETAAAGGDPAPAETADPQTNE